MIEKILILDFGSQYTQLIARAVREANVYCEIIPFNKSFTLDNTIKGIILSGSPLSVNETNAPTVNIPSFIKDGMLTVGAFVSFTLNGDPLKIIPLMVLSNVKDLLKGIISQ